MGLALLLDSQVERGFFEIVCRLHDLAGTNTARQGKLADRLLLGDKPPAGLECHLRLTLDRLVGDGTVGNDKKMIVPGMLEEVEEPLLLEEAEMKTRSVSRY